MLNPIEEDVVGEMGFEFPGGDKDIIARVIQGDAKDMDDDDESDDEDELPALTNQAKHWQSVDRCRDFALSMHHLLLSLFLTSRNCMVTFIALMISLTYNLLLTNSGSKIPGTKILRCLQADVIVLLYYIL